MLFKKGPSASKSISPGHRAQSVQVDLARNVFAFCIWQNVLQADGKPCGKQRIAHTSRKIKLIDDILDSIVKK